VNEHGIVYPPELLREILAKAADAARIYRPDSIGQLPAREAIARYYGEWTIPPNTFWSHREPAFHIGIASSSWRNPARRFCALSRRILSSITSPSRGRADDTLPPSGTHQWQSISITWKHRSRIEHGHHSDIAHNPTGQVADDDQLRGWPKSLHAIRCRSSDEVFSEFIFDMDVFLAVSAKSAHCLHVEWIFQTLRTPYPKMNSLKTSSEMIGSEWRVADFGQPAKLIASATWRSGYGAISE